MFGDVENKHHQDDVNIIANYKTLKMEAHNA